MRQLAHDIITAHILAALACFWWLWFTHGACIQGAFDAFELLLATTTASSLRGSYFQARCRREIGEPSRPMSEVGGVYRAGRV